ncbi:SDR family NAD(P)-dependent oxidoreductase [Wenxinia marina]|uniref:Short-chain dehydrogenase n=1 Tax=Wenxinia marina DSM 24838 TaxID=1123501 RepID=A0A0D0Q777_9RHOB|nr:SDR family NAD(P)-dependent oxidoreductase [Wenxinia marina]KIQ68322.1 Short-chain alcohol dehydrogenase of unknown specificity [Wenxinia marina DSM 24838]GGL79726.1 acetoin dehydrogenase [Wenxinia marina]
MKLEPGQRAYVTGAGSGIGRALCLRLARRGVAVAACDIRAEAAEETAGLVMADGGTARSYALDVSDADAVMETADRIEAEMGEVSLVFNNAGVAMHGVKIHQLTMAEWDWVIGVNLYGVIHGIRAWVPRLVERGRPAHVINTASLAGFQVNPDFLTGAYSMTKYAVVALSETLELELKEHPIGISVVCPAAVASGIHLSGRARPERLGGPAEREANHFLGDLVKDGQTPDEIAGKVLAAVEEGRMFVFTHPETKAWLERRFTRVLGAYEPPLVAPEEERSDAG